MLRSLATCVTAGKRTTMAGLSTHTVLLVSSLAAPLLPEQLLAPVFSVLACPYHYSLREED